jgi:hypothetical protein
MVAGSLPDTPGAPIGLRILPIVVSSCPSTRSPDRNLAHFAAEPIRPMLPRWRHLRAASQIAKSSAWSCVITSTCVPDGTAPSASSGTGE